MKSVLNKNIQIQEILLFLLSFLLPVLFGLNAQSFIFASLFSITSIFIFKSLVYKHIGIAKVYSVIIWVQIFFYFMILWNYSTSITIGSIEEPYIRGDAGTYYLLAKQIGDSSNFLSEITQIRRINYIGYPFFLGFIFKIFYTDLLVGMLFSMFAGILNIFLISYILKLITNTEKIIYTGVFLTAISPHLASTATIILKDVFIISSLLIIIFSALLMLQKRKVKYFILLFIGLIIIAFLRLPYLVIFLGIFFILFFQKMNFRSVLVGSIIFIAGLSIINISSQFSAFNYFSDGTNLLMDQTETITNNWNTESNNSVTGRLVYGYQNWSIIRKIIYIPIFTTIQYLHPFNVWKINHEYPWHYIGINFNLIWLLYLGPLVIFSFLNLKKINNSIIKKLLIISGLGYVFIALTYGGTIPRYSFPFIAIFFIGSAYVYSNTPLKRKFKNFLQLYLFLGLVLVSTYLVFKAI